MAGLVFKEKITKRKFEGKIVLDNSARMHYNLFNVNEQR